MSKVWFITGTSKGFGRVWAEAALGRGDRVVATARNADTLTPLVEPTATSSSRSRWTCNDKAAIDAAVKQAHERFGRLDVVVNNAGYGLFGAIEEITEQQARDQIETNLFGAVWVTQAVLPILREQSSGHIIQVSTIGGVNAFPILGLYHASKWGLEGFTPGARRRGRRVRHQGHARRARGLLDRLARARPRVVADPMPEYDEIRDYRAARSTEATSWRSPATRRPPARRSSSSSTPTSRRCAPSSAPARST